jgi:hypothetical protein
MYLIVRNTPCPFDKGAFFPVAPRPNAGHGFLIIEVSRPLAGTPRSVELPRASDRPVE